MSRIKPYQLEDIPNLKGIFEEGHKIMGFYPNDGLIMAHNPALLKSFLGVVQAIYQSGKVEGGLIRMIGLVCSQVSGCEYCQAHTSMGSYHNKVDEEKIKAVWDFRNSNLFTDAERAALEIAFKSSMIPNEVVDEDFDRLKEYFSDEQIVDIVAVISLFGFLNKWNSTLNTSIEKQPQEFLEKFKRK